MKPDSYDRILKESSDFPNLREPTHGEKKLRDVTVVVVLRDVQPHSKVTDRIM